MNFDHSILINGQNHEVTSDCREFDYSLSWISLSFF